MFRYFLRLIKISFYELGPEDDPAPLLLALLLLSSYPSMITLMALMNQ